MHYNARTGLYNHSSKMGYNPNHNHNPYNAFKCVHDVLKCVVYIHNML